MARNHDGLVVVLLFGMALAFTWALWSSHTQNERPTAIDLPTQDIESVVVVRRANGATQHETWLRTPQGWQLARIATPTPAPPPAL